MTSLHQVIPILHAGDAVGVHSLLLRELLHDHGVQSEIYTLLPDAGTSGLTRPVTELPDGPVVYQMAVVSELVDLLVERRAPVAVNYHNITPPWFFAGWDAALTAATAAGRAQLLKLAPVASCGLADSSFNARDLYRAGFTDVVVTPVLIDVERAGAAVDERYLDKLRADRADGGTSWLFVGRVVPNKAQHDVVAAFALYRRDVDPAARLDLVGAASSASYVAALRALIASLGLGEVVRLVGSVPPERLAAHFEAADVFVCLSDHEGFCVPVIEAMHHGIPVVAVRSSALTETIADAGVLVAAKDPTSVAAAVVDALRQRDQLRRAGEARAAEFSLVRTRALMWSAVERLLS